MGWRAVALLAVGGVLGFGEVVDVTVVKNLRVQAEGGRVSIGGVEVEGGNLSIERGVVVGRRGVVVGRRRVGVGRRGVVEVEVGPGRVVGRVESEHPRANSQGGEGSRER